MLCDIIVFSVAMAAKYASKPRGAWVLYVHGHPLRTYQLKYIWGGGGGYGMVIFGGNLSPPIFKKLPLFNNNRNLSPWVDKYLCLINRYIYIYPYSDLPRTGSETNTTIFVIYTCILGIDSHCPYLLSGETTWVTNLFCQYLYTILQNTDFGVLQKSSKHFLISIFFPLWRGTPLPVPPPFFGSRTMSTYF